MNNSGAIKSDLDEERLQAMILPYITAYESAEELGEPEFDACCNPSDLSRFLARKLLWSIRG